MTTKLVTDGMKLTVERTPTVCMLDLEPRAGVRLNVNLESLQDMVAIHGREDVATEIGLRVLTALQGPPLLPGEVPEIRVPMPPKATTREEAERLFQVGHRFVDCGRSDGQTRLCCHSTEAVTFYTYRTAEDTGGYGDDNPPDMT